MCNDFLLLILQLDCKKNNILVFKGFLKTKSLRINNKILLISSKNYIVVSCFFNNNSSKINLKNAILKQSNFITKIKEA